jgi:hypothetical protein
MIELSGAWESLTAACKRGKGWPLPQSLSTVAELLWTGMKKLRMLKNRAKIVALIAL